MEKAKLTRAEQRSTSRAAVLKAALYQFSHFGFEGASINVIAEQSGVSKPNIIYYFGTKNALWKEAVTDLFERVNRELEAIAKSTDTPPSMERMISAYFDVVRRHPAHVLIPMVEGVNDTWRTQFLAENFIKKSVANFDRTVKAMVERGQIVDVPPLHLQNLITGGAQLFLALAPLWARAVEVDTTDKKFVDAYGATVAMLLNKSV